MNGNNRLRLFNSHPGNPLLLDQVEAHANRGLGLRRGAGKLGVALAGMDIAQIEERARMKNRQLNPIPYAHVPNVKIAAPFALSVDAGGHLALRRDADRSDKRRDWPGDAITETEDTISQSAAWP